jgi:hypothetical protein
LNAHHGKNTRHRPPLLSFPIVRRLAANNNTNTVNDDETRLLRISAESHVLAAEPSSLFSLLKESPHHPPSIYPTMPEIAPTMSQEEAEKLVNESLDDDFKDAVENEDDTVDGEFRVTPEELAELRAHLTAEFPTDSSYLSDAYILSVASKPYSKDPSIRRPLEYSKEKLSQVMSWRREHGAPDMETLVTLANGSHSATEAVEQPDKLKKAKAIVNSLNTGSMYWHGYTKDGRPILWIRTNRKPWYPDVEAEANAMITMADAGIRVMPDDVTDFVCVAESSYPPPPNPSFMITILQALVKGYPDRLDILYSAPVSSIVQFVMNLLLPLMPGRLASKVVLLGSDDIKERLSGLLLHGEDDLPTFFGGSVNHDELYPEEGKCPNRGEGTLKFDYFGMLERLDAQKKEYLASKK